MPWFKVDDQFHASRKLNSIPKRHRLQAAGLWAIAGSWVSGQETDGFVPDYMIQVWSPTQKTVDSLVESGLWIRENDGFRFYSWLNYNPSKEDSDAKRAASKERMRQSRERNRRRTDGESRNQDSKYAGNGAADEDVTLQHPNVTGGTLQRPDPTRPDPTLITTDVVIEEGGKPEVEPEKPKRANARLLPENWEPSEKVKKDLAAQFPTYDLERILRRFHDYWHSQPVGKAKKRDWDRTFRNWVDSETRPPLISERTQPTAPGRLSNAEVARQLQERNAQDQAQQRELSNAEAMQAWLNTPTPKAIGF